MNGKLSTEIIAKREAMITAIEKANELMHKTGHFPKWYAGCDEIIRKIRAENVISQARQDKKGAMKKTQTSASHKNHKKCFFSVRPQSDTLRLVASKLMRLGASQRPGWPL